MMLYYILLPFAWLLWHLGFRIRVEGRENLKKVQTKGYILAPTHVSAIDPVFIAVTVGRANGHLCQKGTV
jgi:1-acyl-sn-glycerol-3-phosphate acyltransferase